MAVSLFLPDHGEKRRVIYYVTSCFNFTVNVRGEINYFLFFRSVTSTAEK